MRDSLGSSGMVDETLGQPAYKRHNISDRDARSGKRSSTWHHRSHRRYLSRPGTFTSSRVDIHCYPEYSAAILKMEGSPGLESYPRCGVWCLTLDRRTCIMCGHTIDGPVHLMPCTLATTPSLEPARESAHGKVPMVWTTLVCARIGTARLHSCITWGYGVQPLAPKQLECCIDPVHQW